MRTERSIHGLSGDGQYHERQAIGPFVTYKRVRVQKWSPVMSEIEVECGVRVGRWRFGLTSSKLKFSDGQEPAVQYKRYGL
jgi:hypothetical protein